jgi:curli biogenesis system outer membrane secretion channel CsgG
MKRFFLIALILAVMASAISVTPAFAAGKKIRVAVVNFANNSSWYYWGDHLGEAANDEFVTQLVNTGLFTVVERQQLQTVLSEQALGASGAVTSSTAAQIGKLTGAQLLFTGSITAFSIKKTGLSFGGVGGNYGKAESKLDVRMIDTSTGEILLVASGAGDKKVGGVGIQGFNFQQDYDAGIASESLRPAIEQVTKQVVAKVPDLAHLAPAGAGSGKVLDVKSPTQIYVEGGTEAGMNVGDTFAVYRVTEEIKDEDGNVLDTVTDKVGEIVVTKVLNKSAIAETKSGTIKKGDQYRKE